MGVCLLEMVSSESEQEEGEIIDVDEFEDISSDEELNLRKRIEELEWRNLELERIASITSAKKNVFEYIDLVDEESSPSYNENHQHHRSNNRTVKQEYSSGSSKRRRGRTKRTNDHQHRHGQQPCPKHEHRKRERTARRLDEEQHQQSSRHIRPAKVCRRRASIAATTRPRSPIFPHFSSSEDELESPTYRPNRRELQAALMRDAPISKFDSSLERKLKGVQQKCVTTLCLDNKMRASVNDPKEDANTTSEILDLLNTLTEQKIIDGLPSENELKFDATDNDAEISELEKQSPHSLEEQELRMAALKSAVLKKHEARKRRRVAERPYSPTDMDLLDNTDPELNHLDVRNDLENMEISPAVSPGPGLPDKSLLPVDMDLASEDESINEPVCNLNDNLQLLGSCLDVCSQWIPLPPSATMQQQRQQNQQPPGDISTFTMFQQSHSLLPPPPPPPVNLGFASAEQTSPIKNAFVANEDEEEMALRALLLSTRTKRNKQQNGEPSKPPPILEVSKTTFKPVNESDHMDVTTSDNDAESLRNLVFESINKKSKTPTLQETESLKRAVQRLKSLAHLNNHSSSKANHHNDMKILPADANTLPNILANISSERNKEVLVEQIKEPSETNKENDSTIIIATPNVVQPDPAIKQIEAQHANISTTPLILVNIPTESLLNKPTIIELSPSVSSLSLLAKQKIANSISDTTIKPSNHQSTRSRSPTTEPPAKVPRITNLVTNPIAKKVNRMLIQLDDDSSSSSCADETDASNNTNSMDRMYTPLSPAANSPGYIAQSPLTSHDIMMDANSNMSASNLPENTESNVPVVSNSVFAQKLDDYLRSVRCKNEKQIQQEKQQQPQQQSEKQTTPLKVKLVASTRVTPSAVRHLPLAAQIEYRKLVERMNSLEKIKKTLNTNSTTTTTTTFTQQKATLKNNYIAASHPPPNPIKKRPDSLVKRVLVKTVTTSNNDQSLAATQMTTSNAASAATSSISPVSTASKRINTMVTQAKPNASTPNREQSKDIISKLLNTKPNNNFSSTNIAFTSDCESTSHVQICAATETAAVTRTRDQLQKTEDELRSYSSGFEDHVNGVYELVQNALVVRRKHFELELKRDRFRKQLVAIEKELAAEKKSIQTLYASIKAGHQEMRVFRDRSLVLRNRCKELGTDVVGSDYRVPSDETKLVDKQIRKVVEETQKLKALKKTDVVNAIKTNMPVTNKAVTTTTTSTSISYQNENALGETSANNEVSTNIPKECSSNPENQNQNDLVSYGKPADVPLLLSSSSEIDTKLPTKDVNHTAVAVASESNAFQSAQLPVLIVADNTQAVAIHIEPLDLYSNNANKTINDADRLTEQQLQQEDVATGNNVATITKYQSPLDVMQTSEVINPDAVLCPYELQGSCDDQECLFQHLGARESSHETSALCHVSNQ